MTQRIQNLLGFLKKREYRAGRENHEMDATGAVAGLSELEADAMLLKIMLDNENPRIFDDDIIGFNRSLARTPFYKDGNGNIRYGSGVGNITPNYARIMRSGMSAVLAEAGQKASTCGNGQKPFYNSVFLTVDAALKLAERHREYAKEKGSTRLYGALCRVPHNPPETFYEACVFLKFLAFTLRCNNNSHVTLGRFDQYMYPYYLNDRNNNVSDEELLETLEAFFVAINFDSDVYLGVQQGDNGQSMVLGGYNADGKDCFNDLSSLCLHASTELCLIDPKINLRVSAKTPIEMYVLGTGLTKKGLGFPQYSNDDVVVPGLIKLGYSQEDAWNYSVAACWEFIIPDCAYDIPNITKFNFPSVINNVIHAGLIDCMDFEQLMEKVHDGIRTECDRLVDEANRHDLAPSPYLSLFVDGCMESGKDICENSARYNNSGCHGVAIAPAADALAAVKKMVYDGKAVEKETLLKALDCNFDGCADLRRQLLDSPKMGNNDDEVDKIASAIMDTFAANMNGRKNNRGGIFRAGTGSAHEYIFSSQNTPATAEGRKAGEPYGSSFSPGIVTSLNGPLSVVQSFTKHDLRNIINGGPLTLEIHDATFRNDDGLQKVALLVKAFIGLGGHQLQLNAVNRERLIEANEHPEDYPNLIVRVWGWSGYFSELDRPFREQIIRRTAFELA